MNDIIASLSYTNVSYQLLNAFNKFKIIFADIEARANRFVKSNCSEII